MSIQARLEKRGGKTILKVFVVWGISAAVLCLVGTFFLSKGVLSDHEMGYLSSAISFLAAVMAGLASRSGEGEKDTLLSACAAVLALVILLLTVGFLSEDHKLDPSGVLSVVSFTAAGCLAGALLPGKRNKKSAFQGRRRRFG